METFTNIKYFDVLKRIARLLLYESHCHYDVRAPVLHTGEAFNVTRIIPTASLAPADS